MTPLLATVVAMLLAGAPLIYSGRARQLRVEPPRIEETVTVDGRLDEAAWRDAAILTGFSQFSPQDGIPADDSTEVLVWYSPTAMYFGIRAYERHGAPHATLGQRDHVLDIDDTVQLYLGTFNDAREAVFLAVNPFGVQVDGSLRETYQAGNAGWSGRASARQAPDLSQDIVFDSKGRVTDYGYEVEVRVPFKSLSFQTGASQRWDFNVIRRVQHSGYEDSWTPARRGSVSFLAQGGTLEGLREIHRGLVLDIEPVVLHHMTRARLDASLGGDGAWHAQNDPSAGANARWRVTNNATLNATVKPDFSQVESDAGQVPTDPRARLFFPEKRPFFLDNLDAFATPNNLVYTRSVAEPVVAAKLTGRLPRTSFALLSAVDETSQPMDVIRGDDNPNPIVSIFRVQRDVGALSRLGVTYTNRIAGSRSNQVADADAVLAFGRVYAARLQLAGSRTDDGTTTSSAPLWSAGFDRNETSLGVHYELTAMDPEFQTAAGFIARPGLAVGRFEHRITALRTRGSFLESASFEPAVIATWKYDRLLHHQDALEKKLHLITRYQLRGGWTGSAAVLLERFGYDPDSYAKTFVEVARPGGADTVAFRGTPRLPNTDYVLTLDTPQWKWFSASTIYLWGQDDNFDEWASADVRYVNASLLIHPTERLRIAPSGVYAQVARQTTGDIVKTQRVYRLKTEYQITPAIFARAVSQLEGLDRLALRDEGRTNGALLFRATDGTYTRSTRTLQRTVRTEWLLAWQPGPGRVFFAGYGNDAEPDQTTLSAFFGRHFRRTESFFIKASYLLRM